MPRIFISAGHSFAIFNYHKLRLGGAFFAAACLTFNVGLAQTTDYVLGATHLLAGPTGGTNSVMLSVTPANSTWAATANTNWLHLSTANQSGIGSTNVIFSYDVNAGVTRFGTLTIAGQTLTITQAGANYVSAGTVILASAGLSQPNCLALDGAGNVYISDFNNNALYKWTVNNNSLTTLISSGLNHPDGLTVDGAGNVYIADYGDHTIYKWVPASGNLIALVSWGLSQPESVAVDGAGNVYIADAGNNAIREWVAANQTVTTLVHTGLNRPAGVAVDSAGNVYIADFGNGAIKEWSVANNTVTTLVSNGLFQPVGVAVDGSGNVYIADSQNNAIKKWSAADNSVSMLLTLGLDRPFGVAVDASNNIYIADTFNATIKELPNAFVDPTVRLEGLNMGQDSLPVVLPATQNLSAPFVPVADMPWLTINGISNGVVSFSFDAAPSDRTGNIMLLGRSIQVAQGAVDFTDTLGATSLLEGPAAGSGSVVLAVDLFYGDWTATANDEWLHLSVENQSGTGSMNVVFSYDENTGESRFGTLTIAGQTLTVTQAGSSYIAASSALDVMSTGLSNPTGVAVDGAGNVYIADYGDNTIYEWTVDNDTLTPLVSSGLLTPIGIAVDSAGNVYIADTGHNAIKEWSAANDTVSTLVSNGLNAPFGVAVDSAGNVYIADTGNRAIKEWKVGDSNVTTLVSSISAAALGQANGIAVDAAGNVYIGDFYNNALEKWTAADNALSILASGLRGADGIAVDGAGNVYVADYEDNTIKKWTAADGIVSTLVSSGLNHPGSVAVDGAGNLYIADSANNAIKALPNAYLDPTPRGESLAGGTDALPVVLPATENLGGPFTPTSDEPWLVISGVTNGVVSFDYSADLGSNRTGNINLFGWPIPIEQGIPTTSLGATSLVVGPNIGFNSVLLSVFPADDSWTATANDDWLYLSATNQSGVGSAMLVFSYDANPGGTRSGTLTIGGQTLTVTQAGSNYVQSGPVTTLISRGLSSPSGVAVDSLGNVYIADTGHNAVKKWTVANNTITPLVSSGLSAPMAVAVDVAGNAYIADTGNNAIKKWTVADSNVTTLAASELNAPQGVAVDTAGNVYISDSGNGLLKEWTARNSNMVTLTTFGVSQPNGVAVDVMGNVYIGLSSIYYENGLAEWNAVNRNLTTLIASGFDALAGVAVDGEGNVYIANYGNNTIVKRTGADSTLSTVIPFGLNQPNSVAVDNTGNVYIADTLNNAIKELPYAFVDPTPIYENLASGGDALPMVLPSSENLHSPFAPVSNQGWLSISGITNGVIDFDFTPATLGRWGKISLFGQVIPVVQGTVSVTYSLGTTARLEGPSAGSDSVMLAVTPYFITWTNIANATWLHLSTANQVGTGSTNVVFSYDANSGATRIGTLAIAGQTLTVTQAGSSYIQAGALTGLTYGLNEPQAVAVDGEGNVYFTDTDNHEVDKWTATNNSVSTLVSTGPLFPYGVAVDGVGNVYIAAAVFTGSTTGYGAVRKWIASSQSLTTLAFPGLSVPFGVAVDGAGNVYVADYGNGAIKEWSALNNSFTTLIASGLTTPGGLAVDNAGNVYIADTGDGVIKEWTAVNGSVTTLLTGFSTPFGVAVDGAGDIYVADAAGNSIGSGAVYEWTPASTSVSMLAGGLSGPSGVALDGTGNIYIADTAYNQIDELPYVFVDPTPQSYSYDAGSYALPMLPSTENLLDPFTVSSSQSWLNVAAFTNGGGGLSFSTNSGPIRGAKMSLLGQTIPVLQASLPNFINPAIFGAGLAQFAFSNFQYSSFTVLSSTNLYLPTIDWTVIGTASNIGPDLFEFTDPQATNDLQRFYRVRSP